MCCGRSKATPLPSRASNSIAEAAPRAACCSTVRFWSGLDDVIERYVDGVSLADLAFDEPSAR